ncbi:MAG: hypothetical protein P8124_13785 [Gammaproteobacteria bacterium]
MSSVTHDHRSVGRRRLAPAVGMLSVAAALAAAPLSAGAATWSDTSVGYRTSTRFTEPGIKGYVRKNIYSFTYVGGYKYGTNFFTADFLVSDDNDPAAGGGGGAQEVYAVYRNTVSLGKVSGHKLAFGPVKDVGITFGFDMNSKDTAFAPRVRKFVIGPTLSFDVPGFFDVSLLYRTESNHNGIVGKTVVFDPTYGVSLSWGIPFNSIHAKFTGFLDYIGKKGKNGFGAQTGAETLMRAYLMYDVGALAGKKQTFYAGVGYEYWHNKFGVATGPGNDTTAPMLAVEWHL